MTAVIRSSECITLDDTALEMNRSLVLLRKDTTWAHLFSQAIVERVRPYLKCVEVYLVTKENWGQPIICGTAMGAVHRYADPGTLRLRGPWNALDQFVAN
jgi:hypothetical protein